MVRTASKWLTAGLMSLSSAAQAFTVFACEPEWAALTRILMPQATVHVATHAAQDPHHIEARPSLIAQLRSSDLAVCTGAGLEAGWLPLLQQRAGRAAPLFEAADHVVLIDARPGAVAHPWAGDVHAEGNPHLHTDPHKLLEVSQALAEELATMRPAERAAITQRAAHFAAQWRSSITRWEQRAAALKGRRVVVQHASFAYLWRWLGMIPQVDLEPKPGMAPTPGHLQHLLNSLRSTPPSAIVLASYQDPRAGRWLQRQLQVPVPLLILPATVEETAGQEGLVKWMDTVINELSKLE
ncbi:metal ABC transporter substrate-binding protein [Ideonella sp.]|jgi:zinc/manganese transport system substrate-binding protein|uniref:metal ABC transporter substrate-binding protein n=1 Tax=Ideonella sp. TaxID=1929293 RepID=UPI0037BED336